MNNGITTAILNYAECHNDFSNKDLFYYFQGRIAVNKSSLSWHLFKLVKEKILTRTGRGKYSRVLKQDFTPKPIDEVVNLHSLLQSNFPFAKFCVYQGDIFALLQHHLSSNRVIYVETDRDSTETIFNFIKDKGYEVYLRPDKNMIYRYVDMDSRVVFVKNLVSESPSQKVEGVPMPTLEKLLVDILRDSDFFYLQGSESERIIGNAFNLYNVNRSRLFRYAGRRKVTKELSSILEILQIQ